MSNYCFHARLIPTIGLRPKNKKKVNNIYKYVSSNGNTKRNVCAVVYFRDDGGGMSHREKIILKQKKKCSTHQLKSRSYKYRIRSALSLTGNALLYIV